MKVGVVMPCYRTGITAALVAEECLEYCDVLICVDDNCPINTGRTIASRCNSDKITIVTHAINRGVGGATKTGLTIALQNDCDIIVKIDSDGQMSPSLIPELIVPLKTGAAGLTKGNRFNNVESVATMPPARLVGNIGLGFLAKLSTGYWELFDPTNGFIAITAETVSRIQIEKTDSRYFFETDLLFRCGLYDITVKELVMKSVYKNEISSMRPEKEIIRFTVKHLNRFIKRILYQYFLLDFNPGSLELIGGLIAGVASLTILFYSLYTNIAQGRGTQQGTQTVFLAATFISVQLILGFVSYDASSRPIMRRLRARC